MNRTLSALLKRENTKKADSKAWHKHVIASKRDAEKHQRIISLLTVIQIKLSDYMRQYVWNTELTVIVSFFLQYNIFACYLKKLELKMINHHSNIFLTLFNL